MFILRLDHTELKHPLRILHSQQLAFTGVSESLHENCRIVIHPERGICQDLSMQSSTTQYIPCPKPSATLEEGSRMHSNDCARKVQEPSAVNPSPGGATWLLTVVLSDHYTALSAPLCVHCKVLIPRGSLRLDTSKKIFLGVFNSNGIDIRIQL